MVSLRNCQVFNVITFFVRVRYSEDSIDGKQMKADGCKQGWFLITYPDWGDGAILEFVCPTSTCWLYTHKNVFPPFFGSKCQPNTGISPASLSPSLYYTCLSHFQNAYIYMCVCALGYTDSEGQKSASTQNVVVWQCGNPLSWGI